MALANSIKDFSENHDDIDEISNESISYVVKYIGAIEVESSRSEEVSSAAVKKIISNSKASNNNHKKRVLLSISPKGIEVVDSVTAETILQVSIYRISHCSADASHAHVFSFIESAPPQSKNGNDDDGDVDDDDAKNAFTGAEMPEGVLTCHAFLCQKRKMAQTVTLTVARSFERAFQIWQNQQFRTEKKQLRQLEENKKNESCKAQQSSCDDGQRSLLIDLNTDLMVRVNESKAFFQNTWVSLDTFLL